MHKKTTTLTAQRIPEAPNGTTLPLLANVSVVPANPLEGTSFAVAEILISTLAERFPSPLIYVSNRNIWTTIDPAGDTIAISSSITELVLNYLESTSVAPVAEVLISTLTECYPLALT